MQVKNYRKHTRKHGLCVWKQNDRRGEFEQQSILKVRVIYQN